MPASVAAGLGERRAARPCAASLAGRLRVRRTPVRLTGASARRCGPRHVAPHSIAGALAPLPARAPRSRRSPPILRWRARARCSMPTWTRCNAPLDLGHDLGRRGPGQLDLVRGAEGGLGAWVFVVLGRSELHRARARRRARAHARACCATFHASTARHPDARALRGQRRELDAQRTRAGAIAGIPGIEGGHAIEEGLAKLEWFFERGVRVLTLVWNNHLSWIRSCQTRRRRGRSRRASPSFGREVVRRMNELGMVVDLSHAGRALVLRRARDERAAGDRGEITESRMRPSPGGGDERENPLAPVTDLLRNALRRDVVGISDQIDALEARTLDGVSREESQRARTKRLPRGSPRQPSIRWSRGTRGR